MLQPRQFPAVAHDLARRRFVLFGGTYGATRFDDTWLLGPSGWTIQNLQTHPGARISSSAAYDSARDQVVLFGGRAQQAEPALCSPGKVPEHLDTELFCSDTWAFDGNTWTEKTPKTSPSAREGHAMAFDAARNEVVLFGGTASGNSMPLNDTWIWNGENWRRVIPAHRPPARLWHAMAYDPVHREIVLFGGDTGNRFLDDTWLWDGRDWKAAPHQATPPGLRTNAGMDFDPATGKMVLFSGTAWNAHRNGSLALDCWTWNGSQWKRMAKSKFQMITDFSSLTPAEAQDAIVSNGSPSFLWVAAK